MDNKKIINMIRDISVRNAVVNSSDVAVVFDELDRANERISQLENQLAALARERVINIPSPEFFDNEESPGNVISAIRARIRAQGFAVVTDGEQ